MKTNDINIISTRAIPSLPRVEARAGILLNALRAGEVPEGLRHKLLNLNRDSQPGQLISRLGQEVLNALYANVRGHNPGFPAKFQADAAYVLAYFWEDDDTTPDYQEGGLLDDCQLLATTRRLYRGDIDAFLLKAARPRVELLWDEQSLAS